MPDAVVKAGGVTQKSTNTALDRLAEESFAISMKYGNEYSDENPITGRPGEFHLSSTGRKEKVTAPQPTKGPLTAPTVNTKVPADTKKDAKSDKTPKTPTMPKPKRRKSKIGPAAAAS
jgi:mediator of RNA polymerase II transcription subunit 6